MSTFGLLSVRGVGDMTTKDTVYYYFENRKRSGGQNVFFVDLMTGQEYCDVYFNNPEVLSDVKQRTHVIDGHMLTIDQCKYVDIWKDRILVSGIDKSTTKDGLQYFLEAKSKTPIVNMTYGKKNICVVEFSAEIDMYELEKECSHNKLDGSNLVIKLVRVPNSVIVKYNDEDYLTDDLFFYFDNEKRSGVADLKEVKKLPNGDLLVTFSHTKSVKDVLMRSHVFNKKELSICMYYECLDDAHYSPETDTILRATACNMESSDLTPEECNYYRAIYLCYTVAPKAVRIYFNKVITPELLTTLLQYDCKDLSGIKENVIKNFSSAQLYSSSGSKYSTSFDYDITLLVCLLRNMTPTLAPPPFGFDQLPDKSHNTDGAHLSRIQFYRNELAHFLEDQLSASEYWYLWNDLNKAILGLGGHEFKKEIIAAQTIRLDSTLIDTLRDLISLEHKHEHLPTNVNSNTSNINRLKNEIKTEKRDDEKLKKVEDILKVMTFRVKEGNNKREIRDFTRSSKGDFIFVDNLNSTLVVCGTDGRLLIEHIIHEEPMFITYLDVDCAAVTSTKSIRIYEIYTGKARKTIHFEDSIILGITNYKGNLVANEKDFGCRLYDSELNEISSICLVGAEMPYLTVNGDDIIFSSWETNSVHCYCFNGHRNWDYCDPKLMSPNGVTADSSGNVWVAGTRSNKITVISSDYKDSKECMFFDVDIMYPIAVDYYQKLSQVVLCNIRGHVAVYQIVLKDQNHNNFTR